MKTSNQLKVVASLVAIIALSLTSCQNDKDEMINDGKNQLIEARNSSLIFSPNAHPYGKTHAAWAEEFWKSSMQLTCEESNEFQTLDLGNNVVGLSGPLGEFTEQITISRNQSVFLPLATTIVDYPCPESEFEPAPGQSMEEFLQEVVESYVDPIVNLHAELDGVSLGDMNTYRSLSDLFYFTGNPELADCFDPCVTGEPQPAVTDGYFVMFKKMQPGSYTLTMHGEIPDYEYEWNITIEITVI